MWAIIEAVAVYWAIAIPASLIIARMLATGRKF
jgi:hypothetical protein